MTAGKWPVTYYSSCPTKANADRWLPDRQCQAFRLLIQQKTKVPTEGYSGPSMSSQLRLSCTLKIGHLPPHQALVWPAEQHLLAEQLEHMVRKSSACVFTNSPAAMPQEGPDGHHHSGTTVTSGPKFSSRQHCNIIVLSMMYAKVL